LQLRDVTASENLIKLSRTVDTISGKAVLKNTMKSKASARPVHIAAETMELLLAHCVTNGVTKPEQFIFIKPNGGMMDSRWFWDLWKATLGAAGVPESYTFHQLRHTQIHRDLKAGNFDAVVSERAGHSSITVTKDRYSASLTKHQMPITEGFGKFFREVTKELPGTSEG
jgi:integrase